MNFSLEIDTEAENMLNAIINNRIVTNISVCTVFCVGLVALVMLMSYSVLARTFVYISNADSREIYVLELGRKNGRLKLVEKVPVTGLVMPLAISPDHKFLYAGLRSGPYSVSSFAINRESGKLTLLKTTALPDNMAHLSTDRTGRFLFGASYSGNKIMVSAIEPSGIPATEPLQIVPTGKNAHCILTDLSNKFLYASNLGDDRLLQYRFDETSGQITPEDPPFVEIQKGAGPRHFVFHPKRRLVFGINELDGTLNSYMLDIFGRLKLLATYSVMPSSDSAEKPWAADIHLTPDGKFLYATERTTSTIAAFRVDDNSGRLTIIGNYRTENQPRGFNISPQGEYLLAAGQKSNSLSVYKINVREGTLQLVSRMEIGKNPNWIEIIELP